MSTRTLASLLLRLYPPSFRERFRGEWTEVVDWHRSSLRGMRFGRVRLAAKLFRDTLRALPAAWLGHGRGRNGRRPRPTGAQDLRHAARALVRNPVFTVAAILSIALGVGVNTATFSVANAVLLRPLPYADPDRLAIVWNEFPGAEMRRLPLSGPEVQMLREEPGLFDDVAGIWSTTGSVSGQDGNASQVSVGLMTPNLFDLLGVRPARGRFHERDESSPVPPGVVLSHEMWAGRWGGDPDIVGGTIDLNGRSTPVLGVLPEGFTLFFPEDGAVQSSYDVYTAMPWDLSAMTPDQHFIRVVGRLRQGVSLSAAATAVAAVAERAKQTYPQLQATDDRFSIQPLHADTVRTARPVLLALLGAVGLFLLLACTNVASLIVARTASRVRELAIRASLGASRPQLAKLIMIEGLLVTVIGAAAGVALGRFGVHALWAARPAGLSRADAIPLDGRVLAFGIGIAIVSAVVFSLVSMLAIRDVDPTLRVHGAGARASRFGRRLRELLTAAEVAVGLVLVTGSALMVQSLSSLGAQSIGFEPRSALTFRVTLNLVRFPDDRERARMAAEIERRLAELPGAIAVGATSHLPFLDWSNWAEAAPPQGTPDADRSAYFADMRTVSPSYMEAIGARLTAGRLFDERDGPDGDYSVIIDETMAARAFPGRDPIGQVLEPARFSTAAGFTATPATVVGVIQDIRDRSPSQPSTGQVFWPFGQSPRWELTFFIRTAGDPLALADAIPGAVAAVHPDLTAARIAPMSDYVVVATALTRFLARVGTLFSVLALVVAAIGLYGVVAFVTLQRTQEIALRVTFGASRREILGGVVVHGLRIGAIGVALGVSGALLLTGFLEGLVYGVSARDPVTLAAVAVLLTAVSILASMVPARRATRLDPIAALRDT